jgi:hypothetical protein
MPLGYESGDQVDSFMIHETKMPSLGIEFMTHHSTVQAHSFYTIKVLLYFEINLNKSP